MGSVTCFSCLNKWDGLLGWGKAGRASLVWWLRYTEAQGQLDDLGSVRGAIFPFQPCFALMPVINHGGRGAIRSKGR